jgi:hypothetical protein
MSIDPAIYILAACMLGGSLGFFACALWACHRIREERSANYWEGYSDCNREHHKKKL